MNKKEKMIKKINNSVFQMINDGYTYREISKKTGYSISKISRLRKQQLLLTIGE
ncbi:MAG: Trp family transcriptional regulator [Candidatus Omnitrophota bacterium]